MILKLNKPETVNTWAAAKFNKVAEERPEKKRSQIPILFSMMTIPES